jgi:predicted TIM-barrel fold metal-dependent hydrolase
MTDPAPRIYALVRNDWLDLRDEDIIDPDIPIIDSHHHLWDRSGQQYMAPEALADMTSGHNVVASVYVECHSMYHSQGPEAFRPVGEVDFASDIAVAGGDRASVAICAAIVGHADLMGGDTVQSVLEAEITAGNGRFRGIRHSVAYDGDSAVGNVYPVRPSGMMADREFRRGFARLAPLGLSFDAWLFYPQIHELVDLARAFPDTRIVLNHCGGPIAVGRHAAPGNETFQTWKAAIGRLALLPNIFVKLGGLGIRSLGQNFEDRPAPPSSEELALAWGPYIETCIAAFGTQRCMFESNFPPDKGQCSYRILFNTFKRIVAQYSAAEKAELFSDTARYFYRLQTS